MTEGTVWRVPHPGPRRGARRPGWGCALLVLLLALAFALWGHGLFRRGVRLAVRRAAQRVAEGLPAGLEPARRERLVEALAGVAASADPEAQGRFLGAASRALEDGRLDEAEVAEIEGVLGIAGGGK